MEGYFMKNLKSILKKLTLILLASFLLVGSLNLLAMDPDSDPKGEAVPSFHEAGAQAKESRVDFEGAEDSEDSDSDSDTESESDSDSDVEETVVEETVVEETVVKEEEVVVKEEEVVVVVKEEEEEVVVEDITVDEDVKDIIV